MSGSKLSEKGMYEINSPWAKAFFDDVKVESVEAPGAKIKVYLEAPSSFFTTA